MNGEERNGDVPVGKGGFLYKVHSRSGEVILAACDDAIIDGKWKEGKMRLSAPVSFYKDMACKDAGVLIEMAKGCTQVNLVGCEIVNAFIEANLVDERAVISVEGVKHAIVVSIT